MPRREQITYLADIVACCEELEQLLVDTATYSVFISSNYFIRTAERCFQIIGEPLYHIDRYDGDIAITDKSKIMRLRHLITHDYDLINSERLWEYLLKHVTPLKAEVIALLEKEAGNLPDF